jgi:FAD-linked sulfhydryl oxidase
MVRRHIAIITTCVLVLVIYILLPSSTASASQRLHIPSSPPKDVDYSKEPIHKVAVSKDMLSGDVIMPKLGNATEKAELGRASWKLFHTMMARFPDTPTTDEAVALESYIHLFARLYPCGECAGHFRSILNQYPPQTGSRSSAAAWACHVHNEVNKSLQKELFDCSKIGDFYKCGCAGDDEEKDGKKVEQKGAAAAETEKTAEPASEKPQIDKERLEKIKDNGRDLDFDLLADMGKRISDKDYKAGDQKLDEHMSGKPLKLEKEG